MGTARSEFETRRETCDGCQLDGDVLGAGPKCKEQQQGAGTSWREVQYRLWTRRGLGTYSPSRAKSRAQVNLKCSMHLIYLLPGLRRARRQRNKLCPRQRSQKTRYQSSLRGQQLWRKRKRLKRKHTQKRWDHRGQWWRQEGKGVAKCPQEDSRVEPFGEKNLNCVINETMEVRPMTVLHSFIGFNLF